jgi:hypothetical protein
MYYSIDIDPKYYLRIKTDKPVCLGIERYDRSSVQVFALHNPVRFFGMSKKDILGKKFKFQFTRSLKSREPNSLKIADCE